uniref:BZIP domain-containing protein n=1 Tax=Rhabditophanes sp. KR3021 TaxID=114890 RepID=A0AC35U4L3_9BILA
MAAPPSADDLMQRSLFSSIFNFKFKPSKVHTTNYEEDPVYRSPAPHYMYDQDTTGTSSSSMYHQNYNIPHHLHPQQHHPQQLQQPVSPIYHQFSSHTSSPISHIPSPQLRYPESECYESAINLGINLANAHIVDSMPPSNNASANSLNNHHHQIQSPMEIFNEIKCECAEFEKNNYMINNNFDGSNNMTGYVEQQQPLPCHQPLASPPATLMNCPTCQHHSVVSPAIINQQQPLTPPLVLQQEMEAVAVPLAQSISDRISPFFNSQNSNLSVEQVIKIVLATMKESSVFPFPMSNKNRTQKKVEDLVDESPEMILQRKRQQNNEAAARYRQRQKEAKKRFDKDIEVELRQNNILRQQISTLEQEITLIEKILIKQR